MNIRAPAAPRPTSWMATRWPSRARRRGLVLAFAASTFGGLITSIITLSRCRCCRWSATTCTRRVGGDLLFGLTLIAVIAAEGHHQGPHRGFFGLMAGGPWGRPRLCRPAAPSGLGMFDGVPLIPARSACSPFGSLRHDRAGDDRFSKGQERVSGLMARLPRRFAHRRAIGGTSSGPALSGLVVGVCRVPGPASGFCRLAAVALLLQSPEAYGKGYAKGVWRGGGQQGRHSGTLVPLLAIGIPGGSTAAVMMIVLQFHGVPFGPGCSCKARCSPSASSCRWWWLHLHGSSHSCRWAAYLAKVTVIRPRLLAR